MSDQPLKEFYYEPTADRIIIVAPDFMILKFGHATNNLTENTAESHWILERFQEIKQLFPTGRIKVLLDFTTIDSSEYNSDESNRIYREMLHDDRIEKVAVFGLHTGWALFLSLISIFAPHKMKTFDDESQARAWLNQANVVD